MNKEKLGILLTNIRNGRKIHGLTHYAIQSIEEGRSSYPVANLLVYCEQLSVQFALTDLATDEVLLIDTMEQLHEALQMLMKRYQIDEKMIYRQTGVHYTAPKDENKNGSLSINTLLAMCQVIHCRLDFIQSN